MWGLLSKAWRPLLIPLSALAFFLGAYFFYYRGDYDPPPEVEIAFEKIEEPSSSFSSFEVPSIRAQQGVLLLDGAHGNNFNKGEISSLLSRVADRGYAIEFIGEANPFGGFSSLRPGERLFLLNEKLRGADSFAVILPEDPYLKEEVDIVEEFVRKGGKVILIADPTRDHEINSLAERFWHRLSARLSIQSSGE